MFRNASEIGLKRTPRFIKLGLRLFELSVSVSLFEDFLPVCGLTLREMQ
jgi:hypothetical protein